MKPFPKSVWARVTKKNPCAVCKKPDYCTYTSDASCCMRVQSSKPMKNGGWLHKNTDELPRYIPPPKPTLAPPAIQGMLKEWKADTTSKGLISHAEGLGVDPMALHRLGAVWSERFGAWAYPMKDCRGKIIGIRLRNEEGRKWAVSGSQAGIFISSITTASKDLMICEGPTDTAAAITLGFQSIGRPSCQGQEQIVLDFIRIREIRSVILVTDNDTPGIRGAQQLQARLKVPSRLWIPPAKDIREFLRLGGTRQMIESSLKDLIYTIPKKVIDES